MSRVHFFMVVPQQNTKLPGEARCEAASGRDQLRVRVGEDVQANDVARPAAEDAQSAGGGVRGA